MENSKPKQTIWNKLFRGGGLVFIMFVWELVEEVIENLIAYGITSITVLFAAKVVSTFGIVALTQLIKSVGKRILFKITKKLTYKEGNDKVNKIKQFFVWLFCNKKSLLGVASSAVMTLSGAGVIDVNALPPLMVGAVNITPILYYVVLAIFAIIGICGNGFEKIKTYFARVEAEKAEKEQKTIEKVAQKELKAEEKLANQTQAQQEKAQAKADAEAAAKAEKEAAEKEKRAKIEEAKAKIIAENNAKQN